MLHLIEVTEEFDGAMLLDFLCQHLPQCSVRLLRRLITGGAARVGEDRAAVTDVLHAGDVVSAEIPEDDALLFQPRKLPLTVLYEDRRVIAVDKPPGLSVLTDRRGGEPTFINGLMHYLATDSPHAAEAGVARPLIVHRLDRDASGVLVVAKDREALRALSQQFAAHSVVKEYLALVHGRVVPPEGLIDAPLAVDRKAISVSVDREHGKPSTTRYKVEEQFSSVALVRVRPETGRLHQIRVHLREAGYPILCDPLYGDRAPLLLSSFKRSYRAKADREERPLIARLALHAERLSFVTPDGDRPVEAAAALPGDLAVALKMLRKYSPS